MEPVNTSPNSPRRRGRPSGTTHFAEQDLALLVKFAEFSVDSSSAKLTPFIKSSGIAEEKDIRRLQVRWRKHSKALLDEAQLRLDAYTDPTIIEMCMQFVKSLDGLDDVIRPAIDFFTESLERVNRRNDALNILGKSYPIPINLADLNEVKAAIDQYELEFPTTDEALVARIPSGSTSAELPQSLKFHIASVMFHQLSLQSAEQERAQLTEVGTKISQQNPQQSEAGKDHDE